MAVVTVMTLVGTVRTYTLVDNFSGVAPSISDYSNAGRWQITVGGVNRPFSSRKIERALTAFANTVRRFERGQRNVP